MKRRGFTLLEVMVASALLAMLVVVLSMVFNSSAISWRTGRASVSGLGKFRTKMTQLNHGAENALPHIQGYKKGVGYVNSVWVSGSSLVSVSDGGSASRGVIMNMQEVPSALNNAVQQPYISGYSAGGGINAGSARGYIIGVGSAGPDGHWNTTDDIATWPAKSDGGI